MVAKARRAARRLAVGLSGLACLHAAGAAGAKGAETGATMAAGPTLFVSSDSEHFETRRVGVDFFPAFGSSESYIGVRYRHHEFTQDDWRREGDQLALAARGGNRLGAWRAEAGVMQEGPHDLLTLDAGHAFTLSPDTSAEIFVDREFVETQAALDNGVHFTFAGASLEHRLHPKLTLVGVAGLQHFSDDNDREHARVRVIFQPDLDLGLTFQYRFRYYRSDVNDTRRTYFNPERYRESMLLAGWRYRRNGWVSNLVAGRGVQHIADAPSEPSRLFELSLDSPPKGGQVLGLRAGYLQAASYGGPDYRYRYLQANWVLRF